MRRELHGLRALTAFAALLIAVDFAPAAFAQQRPAPEAASGRAERELVRAEKYMIATANPLASEAGRSILRAGGSAVDAAIAAQLVLNLVEPQSSGIGGGAFLLHWSRAVRTTTSYDGRETAPAAATPERFLDAHGKPLPFAQAVAGGRSVGVPGVLRLLELAHRKHGKLPWATLFEPAIALAENGFAVSPRLNKQLSDEQDLKHFEASRAYFFDAEGRAWPVGHVLVNKPFAETLRTIAAAGADAFYSGAIARDIVATVTLAPVNPGDMTESDLAGYRAVERPPICGPYRVYTICGMGPPSSGALTMLQILGMLAAHDLSRMAPLSAPAVHLIAEAGRLAYADRGLYMADADFVKVPARGLIHGGYIAARGGLIRLDQSMKRAEPGEPPYREGRDWGRDASPELPGTSHISVVDAAGDAVAMTTTIEDGFGSRLMTRGFLLNNQLTDFSFAPLDGNKAVANRVEPGKRPRSSMSPTFVFGANGDLLIVAGSPGGSAIINYVVKTLVAMLDWGMDPQAAISLPNIGSRNGPTELEQGTAAEALKPALEAMGHPVRAMTLTSGTQAILILRDGLAGGADPRREGAAAGD